MKKYRISKRYYRGRDAVVKSYFVVECYKMRFSLFKLYHYSWKVVEELNGSISGSWWQEKHFEDYDNALVFMRNMQQEIPSSKIVYENN